MTLKITNYGIAGCVTVLGITFVENIASGFVELTAGSIEQAYGTCLSQASNNLTACKSFLDSVTPYSSASLALNIAFGALTLGVVCVVAAKSRAVKQIHI